MRRKMRFAFPPEQSGEPITSRLIREFNLDFNILQAHISPGMQGELHIEITGTDEDIARGVAMLEEAGITVTELSRWIGVDEERCMHCGACTAVCPSGALYMDEEARLRFSDEKCVLCEACISVCPVRALRLTYE